MNELRYGYRRAIAIFLILILLTTIPSISMNLVFTVEGGKYGNIVPTTFELELLDKINENRTANGAGILKPNTTLFWVARAHSQDMIDYDFFDHTSSAEGQFNGATFSERVRNYAEYGNSYIGECLAIKSWGIDVESTMASWKGSPPHWDIIIDPNFNEIGIGLLEGEWGGSPDAGLHTAVFGGASISVDLSVAETDIEFTPSLPMEGQEVNISVTIHNQGLTDAYPVNVTFFEGDPDSGGIQIGDTQHVPFMIIHGESALVNVTWNTSGKPGSHDIYMVVDNDNVISETNEGNNKAFKTIFVNSSNPSIPLEEGWNLVSFPYIVSNSSIDSVLGSINSEFRTVQYYNSSDILDPWKHYNIQKPEQMNDLSNLDNRMGFYIFVTEVDGTDLFISGDAPASPQNISLHEGWNLVGYPSTSMKLRNEALNNLDFGTQIDIIQYYDNLTKTVTNLEDTQYMEPGIGYWVHATLDCEWVVE